jgi:hypothetical protein
MYSSGWPPIIPRRWQLLFGQQTAHIQRLMNNIQAMHIQHCGDFCTFQNHHFHTFAYQTSRCGQGNFVTIRSILLDYPNLGTVPLGYPFG